MASIDPASATIGSLQLLHSLSHAPPIDRRGKGAATEVRQRAYVEMQQAAWAAVNYQVQLRALTPFYAQPLKGNWYFSHALRTTDKMALVADRLIGALLEVRACGGPEVRAAAEQLLARVAELQDLGAPAKRREQSRQDFRLQQLLSEFGIAQRDFTIIVRRDLGYDPKLRQHWWQLWRPRTAEWPGGWPVEVHRTSRIPDGSRDI